MSVTKVGKTKTSGGAVDYVFRREKDGEQQPCAIGGNIFGTTRQEIKTEFREQEKLNSNVKNTITHFSISFPVGKKISDEDAADFADELMRNLGYEKNPYIVVRHFDKEERTVAPYAHIHIVASRIKDDGTLIEEWKIAEKAIEATKKIDWEFGFESVAYVKLKAGEQRERNIKKDEYQMMTRTSKLSVLEEFKDCAAASLNGDQSEPRNIRRFVKDLQSGGFEVLPNVSQTTGRMHGFSFAKDGIAFTASRAGKEFKWANLSKELDYQPETDTKFLQQLKTEVTAAKRSVPEPKNQIIAPEKSQPKLPAVKQTGQTIAQTKQLDERDSLTKTAEAATESLKTSAPTRKAAVSTYLKPITEKSIIIEEEKSNETTRQRGAAERSTDHGNQINSRVLIGDDFGESKTDDRRFDGSEVAGKQISRTSVSQSAIEKEPDTSPTDAAMEDSARIKPAASVEETQIVGTESAALRSHRTDDETARRRPKITGDIGAGERIEKEDTVVNDERERRIDRRPEREDAVTNAHRRTGNETKTSREFDSGRGETLTGSDESTPITVRHNREVQSANDGGIEDNGFVDTRILPPAQPTTGDQNSRIRKEIGGDDGGDTIISATSSGSEKIGDFIIRENSCNSQLDRLAIDSVDSAIISGSNNYLLFSEQRFESGTGSGTGLGQTVQQPSGSGTAGKSGDRTEFHEYDSNPAENIAGNREILQSAAGGAAENRAGSVETNRRTAEKTAQLINVKRFSGGLDSQIVAEWTTIIEQSSAANFLDEIVKLKSREEEGHLFGHLDAQAALIAERLKLPKPKPEAEPNSIKLAVALTEIQVSNYETDSGKAVNDKAFEVLVEENLRRAAAPPQSEQIARLRENFNDLPIEANLTNTSDLEAAALNALINKARTGYDVEAIIRIQQVVNLNDAAARETATLVQIAYGGQADKFTPAFKDDLAEQIYYAPTPAIGIYRNFRQFGGQQMVNNFAPLVNSLAEQYKIEIKPPESDLERNKLLVDFVAQQLVNAYESQNSPLEKYVQNQITQSCFQAGQLTVPPAQKDLLAAATDQNLEPPEFKRSLEASARNLTKYDEEKKAVLATEMADRIREAAQIKAEKHAAIEREEVPVMTMR